MNQIFELSLLYDFYGALLKEHKRTIFEDYVLNDYSLSEIASE
ncbi:MAG: DNA-binding protein, partial [Lachnospiraceae bacterium]|nr:DNA-binding protein [Lachnospiraceae bacterium]